MPEMFCSGIANQNPLPVERMERYILGGSKMVVHGEDVIDVLEELRSTGDMPISNQGMI